MTILAMGQVFSFILFDSVVARLSSFLDPFTAFVIIFIFCRINVSLAITFGLTLLLLAISIAPAVFYILSIPIFECTDRNSTSGSSNTS